tara:strand:+ start:276 stop:488 length:213 start_codon:yes stop_codon:yes gene_type:complete
MTTSQEQKLIEFLCTLRQSAAQLIDSTHSTFTHALESAPSMNFNPEDQKMIHDWQEEIKTAHEKLNENEL